MPKSNLSDIRCTANPASITSADLIEAADEIAEDIDGAVTRESIAEACDLPVDCDAITGHVVSLIGTRKVEQSPVKREGDGYFTDDAEYVVSHTHSGYKVTRGDGCYAEFLGSDEAHEAAELLANGDKQDRDYLWTDPRE